MTVDEVMSYRRATPFRPFVLHLKDGPHGTSSASRNRSAATRR